jgi:hypothetical protein
MNAAARRVGRLLDMLEDLADHIGIGDVGNDAKLPEKVSMGEWTGREPAKQSVALGRSTANAGQRTRQPPETVLRNA